MIARAVTVGDWVDLLGEWREVLEVGHNAYPDYTGFVPTVTMMFLGSVRLTVAVDHDLLVRPRFPVMPF
jgi:hypothetical protein